jgi:hypothetical protein
MNREGCLITKIISGGQTGADQAALDAAIEEGVPYGGWLPKGRITEEGVLPERYLLDEMPEVGYKGRTEKNVVESDGTLIISHGELKGGSALTRELAKKYRRPFLHLDLSSNTHFKAAAEAVNWIFVHQIRILNVAGPRASQDPAIYDAVRRLIKTVIRLDRIKTNRPELEFFNRGVPDSLESAVERLESELTLKDRAAIARMVEKDLLGLQSSLGQYIIAAFRLPENRMLMQSCRIRSMQDLDTDGCSLLILRELWLRLRQTHGLRLVFSSR